MAVIIVTGSSGLVGSETVKFFHNKGFNIIGIDNDMRAYFFGNDASTDWQKNKLIKDFERFKHFNVDIRDWKTISDIFNEYGSDIKGVIHTAAQPSHDWAAKEPFTDFTINANGTLNLLEATRQYCPQAVFIFTSTNKVYGDSPNFLPLIEHEKRWEIDTDSPFFDGIDETMTIDKSKHSLFGASKVAADILVQEYGRYFAMRTGVFRGGCLTGPAHSGAELHGFLAYLVKCAIQDKPYTIYGYKGKQVRDNIHSTDLLNAFWEFFKEPRLGEVYNIGGSRYSNISVLEAIDLIEEISGHRIKYNISEENRIGDHIWYVSDISKFINHYPQFKLTYNIKETLKEMIQVTKNKIDTTN